MKFIGITGGVGAGKSEILSYLAAQPGTKVMLADEIAHRLMEPGTDCSARLTERFAGEDIFLKKQDTDETPRLTERGDAAPCAQAGETQGGFDREKLAAVIFADAKKRAMLNAVVHPAVKEYVLRAEKEERERGEICLLVLEAALLIEEHYDEICDELWYIDTNEAHRRERLMKSRGYSPEKIAGIFASQMEDAAYRRACRRVIDNNGTVEETIKQVDAILADAVSAPGRPAQQDGSLS